MDIEDIIDGLEALLETLADQQAMPDESWRHEWNSLKDALIEYDNDMYSSGEVIS